MPEGCPVHGGDVLPVAEVLQAADASSLNAIAEIGRHGATQANSEW